MRLPKPWQIWGHWQKKTVQRAIDRVFEINRHIVGGDGRAWIRRLLEKAGTAGAETTLHLNQILSSSQSIPSGEFTAWLEQTDAVRSEMLSFMASYDVILCPIHPIPAHPHGLRALPNAAATPESWGRAIAIHTPTIWQVGQERSSAVGTSQEGLPIGVQIVARPWREDVVLAVAQHLETVLAVGNRHLYSL